MPIRLVPALSLSALLVLVVSSFGFSQERIKVLFLGDQGPHRPAALAEIMTRHFAGRGIDITYTEELAQLSLDNLRQYAGLVLYANIDELPSNEEGALLEYVAEGGGFIPLHCASFCFRNSAPFIDLVGAQFQRHGGQVFSTEIVAPEHPIMMGFDGFLSWDETYIHTRHNDRNRIVLEARTVGEQAEGRDAEPWTWVRTHGKGRVFYTAWGHDERTWQHAGFLNLVERGLRWATGGDPSQVPAYTDSQRFPIPQMTTPRRDVEDFAYEEVGPKIPNYLAGERWGTQGEVQTRMQKPLTPEESLKHYVTPEDFHLELFASEPDLSGKPIAMNWDERGRLWVCETVDYPNELMPPGEGRDRIRICEDTDGDGRADKFTIYAEQLSVPSSLEFCQGGVIVQAGVQTLFLRDEDGDDRADRREVLIEGWAMEDTHGGVSNFHYGLDNRYWAVQGYNNSKPKFAGGEHPGFRMGPFAFRVEGDDPPQVTDVEFIRSTTNNSWGLGISEEGLIFASTANRAPSFFVPIPNRYYERVRGWTPSLLADYIAADHYFDPITDKVRQVDHHGGFTAGAGHALYTARAYPKSWWNRLAFVCGPTGHLVGTFILQPEGTTFRDYNAFNLIASDDEWAAPIMAEVGPDGQMWIIDWYNYIVQHNPTPQGFTTGKGNAYESDLRDKQHGRIYRLIYDGETEVADATTAPDLRRDDPRSLVAGLQHSNRLWRRHAQRLIVESRATQLVPDLVELLRDQTVDITGSNPPAVHALWTLKGLGALSDTSSVAFDAAVAALSHPAPGVRRNAALVLPATEESLQALMDSQLVDDEHPQVRLAALMALADMPADPRAGQFLAGLTRDRSATQDRYLLEAIICAAASHANHFLNAMLTSTDGGPAAGSPSRQAAQVIAEHIARTGLEAEAIAQLLGRLVRSSDGGTVTAIIEGLAAGSQRQSDVQLSDSSEAALISLLEKADTQQLSPLLALGMAWGSRQISSYKEKLSDSLLAELEDNERSTRQRLESARQLVRLLGDSEQGVLHLVEAITPQMPPQVAGGLIRAMTEATAENVGSELVAAWPSLTPSLRNDVIAVLITRPQTTRVLLDAMEKGKLAVNDLSLEQRQSLANHSQERIRRQALRLLEATGGRVDSNRQQVIEQYAAAAHGEGNAAQGKLLYQKNCGNCHRHSGEGNEVGPDLTGMAVHPKEELLVHILDPNRSVEGNFRRYSVLTADGQILVGMLVAESLSAIEIVDAEGKRQSIARDDVERLTSTNLSLMPEGFEQQLQPEQMNDLLEFLTSKGQFVPLPLGSVATAVSTKPLFSEQDGGPDRLIFSEWGTKEFAGVPFQLVDPLEGKKPNIVMLHGPRGPLPPRMPKQVTMPCNMQVKQFHLLSGISGWGYPFSDEKTVSMIVRLHYQDGQAEDHPLVNGVHFADYIRRVDVPESQFAFALRGQQVRYLTVRPQRAETIASVQLIKGEDATAPMVFAVTAERQ